jgi:hypothetical protein
MYTPSATTSRTKTKLMKTQRPFKARNYSRGCLLAKAFGVLAANSGERTPLCGFNVPKRKFNFFEMSAFKILRKGEVNQINNRQPP